MVAGCGLRLRLLQCKETATMMDNNNKGQLVVAHPPPQPTTIRNLLLFYGIVPILVPTFLTYKFVTDKPFRLSFPTTSLSLYYLVSSATIRPISKEWYFQDVALLQKLWRLPSARAYIDKDTELPLLEYQIREGYCGSATQRCILRSFGLCPDTLPPQKSGESKPKPWCEHITQIAKEYSDDDDTKLELSTKIVRGNVGYDEFLSALREGLANDNMRIACNYLRSVFDLVFSSNFILAMFPLKLFGEMSATTNYICAE